MCVTLSLSMKTGLYVSCNINSDEKPYYHHHTRERYLQCNKATFNKFGLHILFPLHKQFLFNFYKTSSAEQLKKPTKCPQMLLSLYYTETYKHLGSTLTLVFKKTEKRDDISHLQPGSAHQISTASSLHYQSLTSQPSKRKCYHGNTNQAA